MLRSKNIRFSDRIGLIASHSDFVVRQRTKSQQILMIMFSAVVIMAGTSVIVYNDALEVSVICIIMGLLMCLVGKKYEKLAKELHAAEFMNSMFASTLASGYKFCTVAKANGDVLYCDHGFQDMFPDFFETPKGNLDLLFEKYPVNADDRQKIVSVVGKQGNEAFNISITSGANKLMQPIRLVVEPVPRPSGYVMLRGKAA